MKTDFATWGLINPEKSKEENSENANSCCPDGKVNPACRPDGI